MYLMSYIEDKNVYAAVMFACKMIRSRQPAGLSIHKAAEYYKVDRSEVANYVSQRSASVKKLNSK